MNSTLRSITIALTVFFSALLLNPAFSLAQNSIGLQVKPAIVDDNVTPGQVYHFSVKVTNISSIDRTFAVSALDISGLNNQGLPVFASPGDVTGYSLSSWIVLPTAPITLKAGETADIPFTANVPTSVSPGAHFGGVFFDSSGQQSGGNGSAVAMKVGTILNLQIAGDILEDSRMREFSTDQLVYGAANVNFTSKVENLGNVLVRPHGVIAITDMFGKQVATLTVNDAGAPIFPNSSRSYLTAWQGSGFAIGRYQAVLSMSYGSEGKKTISSTTSFWILPLPLIGSVIGGFLALALALYVGLRVYIRRQLRAMGVARGKEADTALYRKRYQRSGSRLMLIVFTLALLCVILLMALFLLFA